jgi:diguanylate cyclase (GGDEF)-like protein
LRELLESAQSEFLDETLAVFVPSGGAFQAIVHCGAINAAQSSTAVQSSLHRAAALREARIDVAGDGTWAVYPVFNRGSFIGGLVVYRPKRISESIERPELQRLVDDMAPVIGNVSDIIATQDAANVDALTGVLNRFGLEAQLARLAEHAFSGVAMMVDIDAFKAINDTVGHQRGDAVLQAIAGVISEHSRQGDVVGRFGGDEFLVLLNGVEANEALSIGNRMRDAVAERANATISIGLAAFHQGEDARDFVKRADEALYAAKGAGRNCCVVAP